MSYNLPDLLFVIFSAVTLLSALMVVLERNPVSAAMYMILTFLSTASIYVLLEAYFIAILQVLVYAGAVMVLFLFIIMLLDIQKAGKQRPNNLSLLLSVVGLFLLIIGVNALVHSTPELNTVTLDEVSEFIDPKLDHMAFTTNVKTFGWGLFTRYMLPFQTAGILLLVAMLGVILISKKKPEDSHDA